MRYTEFNLTEDELFELNMSPGNLKKMAQGIDARAGMEFELIVPGVEDEEEEFDSEPDYEVDEGFPTGRGWQRDVISFFRGGEMGNSTSTIQRAIDSLNEDFWSWMDEAEEDFISSPQGYQRVREIATDNVDPGDYDEDSERELQQAIQAYIDENEEHIRDEISQEFRDDADTLFERWLDEQEIRSMSDFGNQYNLDWPYWTEQEYYGSGGASVDAIADDFSQAIGRPVNAASSYHGATRQPGKYVVEPDGSLHGDEGEKGLEFVSPPLTIPEMIEDLDKVAKWAGQVGAYTNDSTGLHINVSVPDQENLDYVKLAMFLGDEYILKQFGREGNHYCKSALQKIRLQAGSNPDKVKEMMRQFQNGLNKLASKMIHTGSTEKFTSINNRDGWIEFRSPGGDWLGEYATGENKVTNTLLRAVVALDVATKPDAFKQEYYKKLYKTLNPKGDDDSIQYFARYAAGELPMSALKSFIKQIQTKREVNKEKPDSGKLYWWRVSKEGRGASNTAIIELVASSEAEALAKAAREWGLRSLDQMPLATADAVRPYETTTSQHPEGRGRPHDPNGRYAIVSREDPAAYQTSRGTEPEYLFRFNMSDPAEQHNGRYILAAWAARNTVDPANYMVVDAERWNTPADAVSGSTQDLQRQRLAAQMPALNTANGNWEIYSIASNNTVYRFAANTEEQAVQAFRIWQDAVREPSLSREGFNLRTTPGAAPQVQQPPARGSDNLPPGNVRWRILDRNDQEVYSFINTTAQSDANQYARNWMINTAPAEVRDRGPFNIVPVT